MYLKTKIVNLDREAKINKIQVNKSAAVATKDRKGLELSRYETRKLSGVLAKLQRGLDTGTGIGWRTRGAMEATSRPLCSRAPTTPRDRDLVQTGPMAVSKHLGDHVP